MPARAGSIDPSGTCPAAPGRADGGACLEPLEPRLLLSSAPEGFSPSDIRGAYGIDSVSFGAIAGTGVGQTIAIIVAFNDPTILADLHAFDRAFNLPDPKFSIIGQSGRGTLPGLDPAGPGNSWALETAMDVEWAHAIAPGANILLVEANSDYESDLMAATDVARKRPGVSVVTVSWGEDESSDESSLDVHFTTPAKHAGITFLAPAGDNGAEMMYPAASPNVISVGGTSLTLDGDGNYVSETGWGNDGQSVDLGGSGGGVSLYEPQPAYQEALVTQSFTRRSGPDVAFDADPDTGVAVYDSYDDGKSSPWTVCAGTSLGCPVWAGIIAIADQGRLLAGLGTLDGATQTLPMIYSLPSEEFHDITTGDNGYAAAVGYDLVTGRGTPIVNLIVKGLIPPKAVNDAVTVDDNGDPNTIDVLANDTDANGSPITIIAAGGASHGTVNFSGDGVQYTLTDLSARADSFTYTVSDAYGGTTTATVNILVGFDDPDVAIGDGQAAKTLTYTDPDGTVVTVSIVKGSSDVHLTGSGLTILGTANLTIGGSAELGRIVLMSTTAASSLKITTQGGADNLATLGGIGGSTLLGKLTAPTIDLVGQGVAMTGGGTIASLTLHDVDADVTMPGLGAAGGVKITAGLIAAGNITLGAPLTTLTASQWAGGSLSAPSVGTISIKGDKKRSLPGDLGADITPSGASAKGVALAKLSVAGTIDAAITAQGGSVGNITAMAWEGGSLTAEWVGQLTLGGDCGADITLSGVGVALGKPALRVRP